MIHAYLCRHRGAVLLTFSLMLVSAIYWPGLSGGWLFDDYPNIVDNHGVQPSEVSVPALVRATLSSPGSDFKRPLASLSFAANYVAAGLDPYWMKLTNLVIHLLNGLLVFVLARLLLRSAHVGPHPMREGLLPVARDDNARIEKPSRTKCAPTEQDRRASIIAALIATGWMLLPINLTAVLYVVQRMESMANLFVLLGLIGYVAGRRWMLAATFITPSHARRGGLGSNRFSPDTRGLALCLLSITVPTAVGLLAKETAVMLPLYALLIEWMLFHFRTPTDRPDWRIIGSFLFVLVLPMVIGLGWLLPSLLKPATWATRDFTMGTRLLSEARVVVDYIRWTLLPTLNALSFYHDDFRVSTELLSPWSTLACVAFLAGVLALMLWLRPRQPLAALGIALFLGCQLLTATVVPLELIYEHRNYFASFGLLLAVVPLLAVPRPFPFALSRHVLLGGLLLCWATLTALTAYAWGNPLRLAENLASRAPQSPRAQYELGRTYIIYSRYDPSSLFTQLAYAPLERSAALPDSSILPEQALIFMNARMHLPLKDAWWDSMIAKLKAYVPGVQDESSLGALTQCARDAQCDLPKPRMKDAYLAALAHPHPSARLLAMYGDYAWNVLDDHTLGERMTARAVETSPSEPAYRITQIRMLLEGGDAKKAHAALEQLQSLNYGGRLNAQLAELRALPGMQ